MGSCMSSDNKKQTNLQHFRRDINLQQKSQIYDPLSTTLFNTLRKFNDVIVIFNDPTKAKEFSGVVLEDAKSLPPKSIKMMYSFKKLVVVGEWAKVQASIAEITKSANVTSIYVISDKQFERFQRSFAIFSSLKQLSQLSTSKIPILVFSSEQLIRPSQKPHQVFIHSPQQRDKQVYSRLRIDPSGIIEPPSGQISGEKQIQDYYTQKIKSLKADRICLLHNKGLSQASLMQILSSYVMHVYETSEISTKQYFSKSLPNAVIINHSELMNQQKEQNVGGMGSSKLLEEVGNTRTQTKNNTDEFHSLFKQYQSSSNPQKTERAYNLISKLLSNMISNPDNDQYKSVKGMNKQMAELLSRNKVGVKLLSLAGFVEKEAFWINSLEAKYLKVIRTDMDLGYRKLVTQSNNPQ